MAVLITCETSGSRLVDGGHCDPHALRGFDSASVDWLAGWVADQLSKRLGVPCVKQAFRRDLVDVSRSLGHRNFYGPVTRAWSDAEKAMLIDTVYRPYRARVEVALEQVLEQFQFAIHLSVRTFEPWHRGKPRRTDVGLLYDTSRSEEAALCMDWVDELWDAFPDLKVRRNYPARGRANHLMMSLRERFPSQRYLGIEVWMNRAWVARRGRLRDEAIEHFAEAFRTIIGLPVSEAA